MFVSGELWMGSQWMVKVNDTEEDSIQITERRKKDTKPEIAKHGQKWYNIVAGRNVGKYMKARGWAKNRLISVLFCGHTKKRKDKICYIKFGSLSG